METPPIDTITITVVHEEEIVADRADLHVTIKGSSLFTGTSALEKAREVRQLVTELTVYGVSSEQIKLQGVQAEVAGGLLGRSSSATYTLKICCSKLEQLPDILGIITAQKQASLSHVEWRYRADSDLEDEGMKDQWMEACLNRASEKARKIARQLGVTLVGVHDFGEEYLGRPTRGERYAGGINTGADFKRDSRMRSADLGLDISHSRRVTYQITITYRISEFATEK